MRCEFVRIYNESHIEHDERRNDDYKFPLTTKIRIRIVAVRRSDVKAFKLSKRFICGFPFNLGARL